MTPELWLAPLRGVTIRAFRAAFAEPLRAAGFTGAFAPFIPANPGFRATRRVFAEILPREENLVPQVIGKDPASLRDWCRAVKDLGYTRADLNAGCPFPMIVRRGRGSGLFRDPDLLERLLEAGCAEMGDGKFSLKTRLGLTSPDELRALLPRINRYPLACLTVHARTARQMYTGAVDLPRLGEIIGLSANPVIANGDLSPADFARGDLSPADFADDADFKNRADLRNLRDLREKKIPPCAGVMVGRAFVRGLGKRADARELLLAYAEVSRAELAGTGDRPVLGRLKELVSYWNGIPRWRRLWPVLKIARTLDELLSAI